jgi:hypothetical protein
VSFTIAGLPLHPLIVHATVVVVPAAALSVLLAALWPRFRSWAGPLPLALAVAALVLDPLTTSSGESLEHKVGSNALIEKHSHLADGLLPWVIALVVMAAALYALHWRQRRGIGGSRTRSRAWLPVVISVVAVVAAAGTSIQVVLIGHSGAEAAWSQVNNGSGSSSSAHK